MAIIFREDKGSPLTIQEVDNNFRELDKRLGAVEKNISPSEGIKEISLEGDALMITGTWGTLLGQCRFPVILFHARGPWESKTSYSVYDVVYRDTKILCCLKNHTSITLEEDQNCWQTLIELPQEKSPPEVFLERKETELTLPLYDPYTLPEVSMGHLGLLADGKSTELIVRGTHTWLRVRDGEVIEKKEPVFEGDK